ncbi:MAG: hypothetical protein Fur0044_08210 [Anaerolineae bacterium]|nr:hypothetical protein [Anaerolineales bacterium]MCQ3972440.1 hypothetical protein [Anaerolineae bacterium]
MQLTIDGQRQNFISLPTFRSQWGLPPEFALAHFEPKEWQGLGSLDGSREALPIVRQRVLAAIPQAVHLTELIPQVQALTDCFHRELAAINPQIGLREVEVEFAVAGFADVMQSVAYNLIQLSHTYRHDPAQIKNHFDFSALYQNWLDASVRVSATIHTYLHQDVAYQIQIIYNAYGRVGLKVAAAGEVYYVFDPALACPAANYMLDLCGAVAQALCAALTLNI